MMNFPERGSMLSRRSMLAVAVMLGGLALAGCSGVPESASQDGGGTSPPTSGTVAGAMTVHRDPSCGCCEAWAEHARGAGYEVDIVEETDMEAVKRRLSVPPELASCHTTTIGDYVIEGHVPLDQVARLLRERPSGIRGIAVPGMPAGSPGMEMPDGSSEPYRVIAFDGHGRSSLFHSAGGSDV